jgi:hypothetical protein
MSKRPTRVIRLKYVFLMSLLLPSLAKAQSTFGDIRGTARDPGGLGVAQALVTLHNLDQNTARNTVTDENGSYLFENLKPGRYEVSAVKEGFAGSPAVTVDLIARQSARVDLSLTIAQVQQTVSVEAAATQIDTENSTVGDTKGNDQLLQMPLNFRAQTTSPLASLALSPNVVTDSQGNVEVGGASYSMTGFSVDGISTADVTHNVSVGGPPP